mmetsp:Transcript_16236/g.35337  ORF Transcript_16236/g.35337 Transcript_16236/m.35337 type:complete len:90 (-) Transcript_16236:59-328(-)
MEFFHMLHLRVFWDQRIGDSFLDIALPIQTNERLVDIIRKEILVFDRSKMNIDFKRDIKYAKHNSGMYAIRILEERGECLYFLPDCFHR